MKSSIREDQSHNYKTALQVPLRHLSLYSGIRIQSLNLKHKVLMLNSKDNICVQWVSLSEIQETL